MADTARILCKLRMEKSRKIKVLKDFLLDCYNEMEAEDQNMHPEIRDNNEEGYRIASNCLRDLEESRED